MVFQFFFSPKPPPFQFPTYSIFMGAGCVFADDKHIIGGYQPHKERPCISGIGGHAEEGETYLQTAYRETIEEIFHVSTIPSGLVDTLIRLMRPRDIRNAKGYVILRFTFEDLETFLRICKQAKLQSPLYTKFPRTLFDLIRTRKTDKNAELSTLCLLPIERHNNRLSQFVHPGFVQDIYEISEDIRKVQTTG
jgi:hypothetical protein